MSEKKVKVLLSAYNGDRYICDQIDSILAQSYQNIEIIVRDDGSADQTVRKLRRYEKEHKIHLIQGENIGFINSFLRLIEESGEADYFAFCDQDDIWLPDKIQMAVDVLNIQDHSVPLLYFSNYDFYSSDMKFLDHGRMLSIGPSFQNALVDCMPLGISSVFNKRTCDSIRDHMPKSCCGHDWWTYLLCAGTGKVIFENKVTVKYRRHEKNVSAGGMDFVRFQIWRFKKFFIHDYFYNVREQIREFAKHYQAQLKPEDKSLLDLFLTDRYSFKNAVKKMFYPQRYRSVWADELMVRFLFLIGRL